MIQSALVLLLRTINAKTYAGVAPLNKSLPVITVELVGSFRNRHWSSEAGQAYDTGLIETEFEVAVWSNKNSDVYTQAQSIVSLLENYSGPVDGMESPVVTYSIADIEITSETSGFDGTTEMYTYSMFLTVTHTIAS
jgi:hypothetical protein